MFRNLLVASENFFYAKKWGFLSSISLRWAKTFQFLGSSTSWPVLSDHLVKVKFPAEHKPAFLLLNLSMKHFSFGEINLLSSSQSIRKSRSDCIWHGFLISKLQTISKQIEFNKNGFLRLKLIGWIRKQSKRKSRREPCEIRNYLWKE